MEELTARKAVAISLVSVALEILTMFIFGVNAFILLTAIIASLAGLLAFLTLILLLVSTRGRHPRVILDPEKYKLAKTTFMYTILFLFIIFLSLALVKLINPGGSE
ncbi:MAG: hypothetical protein QXF56_03480 [Candidatus Micrarchaeia archaeon]